MFVSKVHTYKMNVQEMAINKRTALKMFWDAGHNTEEKLIAASKKLDSMPLYPKVTAPKKQLNAKAFKIYSTLRTIANTYVMDYYKFIEAVEASDLDEDVKEAVCGLCSDACNAIDPQDMGFEISPRNITTDDNGNLIMLDCFYSRKLLRSTYKK